MIGAIIGGIKAAASAFSASKLGGAVLKAAPAVLGNVASTAFNKQQVDTSYQRTMKDMRKAGINPLLAGKVGPIGSAQAADFGGTLSTARQIGVQEQQLEANVAEAVSRIQKMSDEEKSQEIDNEIKGILLKYYKANPNAAVWKDLGGKPLDKITFGLAERILNQFKNVTNPDSYEQYRNIKP
jgi:hypothetical protein